MEVRSAFFTIYGDYIGKENGCITMAELCELLASLNYTEEAVKAAIYRMRHEKIVVSNKIDGKTYYTLTKQGMEKLEMGLQRTFNGSNREEWNGKWFVLIYSLPEKERRLRDRLRREITWLGFGQLTPGTWISPYNLQEDIKRILNHYCIAGYVHFFESAHLGPGDAQALIYQAWDFEYMNVQYKGFIKTFLSRFQNYAEDWDYKRKFAERVLLVHEYRKFLHIDPQLPSRLLPVGWQGEEARQLFRDYYEKLTPGAIAFYKKVRGSASENITIKR